MRTCSHPNKVINRGSCVVVINRTNQHSDHPAECGAPTCGFTLASPAPHCAIMSCKIRVQTEDVCETMRKILMH